MQQIASELENKQFDLYKLELKLKPLGYSIGGGWDYDHGTFDYKLDDEDGGYLFLRLPFTPIGGQLDSPNCKVELGKPFLLSHKYQEGLDDHADTGTFSGTFNQFSEPVDEDADIPEKYIDDGKRLVAELESVLLRD